MSNSDTIRDLRSCYLVRHPEDMAATTDSIAPSETGTEDGELIRELAKLQHMHQQVTALEEVISHLTYVGQRAA